MNELLAVILSAFVGTLILAFVKRRMGAAMPLACLAIIASITYYNAAKADALDAAAGEVVVDFMYVDLAAAIVVSCILVALILLRVDARALSPFKAAVLATLIVTPTVVLFPVTLPPAALLTALWVVWLARDAIRARKQRRAMSI